MSYTPEDVWGVVGDSPTATFEVARATDTETVEATPKSVSFGQYKRGPLVMLNYNKYHSALPPWRELVSFTLEGDGTVTFGAPEYHQTRITANLKTVEIMSPVVKING